MAASLLPCPPVPVLATLTIQLNKTAAELLCLKDIFIYIFFSSVPDFAAGRHIHKKFG
jgi:hypothetical protein